MGTPSCIRLQCSLSFPSARRRIFLSHLLTAGTEKAEKTLLAHTTKGNPAELPLSSPGPALAGCRSPGQLSHHTPPSPWIYPHSLGPSTPITCTPFQHTYGIFQSWKPFHISQIPPLTINALTAPPLPLATCHTHPSPFLTPGNRLVPLLASYEIWDILLF